MRVPLSPTAEENRLLGKCSVMILPPAANISVNEVRDSQSCSCVSSRVTASAESSGASLVMVRVTPSSPAIIVSRFAATVILGTTS